MTDNYAPYEKAVEKRDWICHIPTGKTGGLTTAHVERLNATLRLNMKRYNRATLAFSKKLANHAYALALQFLSYNFAHRHKTLQGDTPAIREGLASRPWDAIDIAALLE